MSRLFVDVDDTLILWKDPEPIATEWRPNPDVVAYVKQWHANHPDGELVVWSSGGRDYAAQFGKRVLPDVPHVAQSKWMLIPRVGDVCIDDAPWHSFAAATIHPRNVRVHMKVMA